MGTDGPPENEPKHSSGDENRRAGESVHSGSGPSGNTNTKISDEPDGELNPEFAVAILPSRIPVRLWFSLGWETVKGTWLRLCEQEAERGTGFLWVPVFFGIGIILYFSLPREPFLWAPVIAAAIFATIYIRASAGGVLAGISLFMALVMAGFGAAKLRADIVDTTIINRQITATLVGRVINREDRQNGSRRYTISVKSLSARYDLGKLPEIIRVTARAKYAPIDLGAGIGGLVRIRPPSGSVFPGGYDFAFQSYFSGIGASGFFLGAPNLSEMKIDSKPLMQKGRLALNKFRLGIKSRIQQAIPGEAGGLAAALIVGDRSGISADTSEALRQSGLAHILAISGLHMALVTASVMFFVRLVLAAFPRFAVTRPIRKYAAFIALAAATVYLTISGASIATQRAWVMISIMLLAILIDRRPLSMRNVALAAIALLVWRPESIVSPGFQMSFAAVISLIAAYEWWRRWKMKRIASSDYQSSYFRSLAGYAAGLAMTSLVAGTATGLFAAYHFHRIAIFGLLGNLAAMPIVSLITMPLALLTMILMPFGLESIALIPMAASIEIVVKIANSVSAMGPPGVTGVVPLGALSLGTLALLSLTLFNSRLRMVSILLAGIAVWLFIDNPTPNILINENGRQVAIIDQEGRLALMKPRRDKFITNIWQRAHGANTGSSYLKSGTSFRCDPMGCTGRVAANVLLAVSTHPEGLAEDCRKAQIIVTRLTVPANCIGNDRIVIDRDALEQRGSQAIYLSNSLNDGDQPANASANWREKIRIETSYGQFSRPWSRHRYR